MGALCLSCVGIRSAWFTTPRRIVVNPHEDKHKAPARPHLIPLSLQDSRSQATSHDPIRSSKPIRSEATFSAVIGLCSPPQPEEGVIDLYLPDLPGVIAALNIKLVGELQAVEFGCELPGVSIVGLIFRRGP